ncbi:hypothetical protein B0H13DRAFT_1919379 [Mycena leptocephala]|nr:hypothetical protein B0H13DRAFT_1919379 [Mycena leptocephala]
MSLPLPATPPGEPIIQVIPKPNVPYEDVQYLLRQGYSEPPPMALPVEARESLGALEGVLTRHWAKYLNKIPIDVDLMFTIAPQCDYLGQYSLPDGQVVHRSAALNAYKILKDRRTGRYFTLAGHDITDTFQPPSSQNQTWQMEMFYPSEERLNEEMHRLAPTHLNPDPDLAFPIHATLQEPPLPSIEERLGIRSNHEPLTVSPSEIFSANFQTADPHVETGFRARTNTAWPSIDEFLPSRNGSYDSVASSMPELEPASSPGDLAADLERLDQDIATRVMQGTHIIGEGEDAKFALFNKDYQEYLNKGMFSSSINTTGLSLGVCEVCFETQHDPWDTCSSGNPPSSAFTVSSEQRAIETVSDAVFSQGNTRMGEISYMDDEVHKIILKSLDADERARQEELEHFVRQTLRPVLNDLISGPTTEKMAWDNIAKSTREAREAFEDLEKIFEARRAAEERETISMMEREVMCVSAVLKRGAKLKGLSVAESEARESAASEPIPVDLITAAETAVAEALASLTQPFESSHADAVPVPEFSRTSIQPIDREEWSSSSAISSSEVSYEEFDPYIGPLHQPAVNAAGEISPAVTAWSVFSDDILENPQAVIDEAIYRVHQQNQRADVPRSQETDSHPTVAAPIGSLNNNTSSTQNRDQRAFEQHLELHLWAHQGSESQADQFRWEDETTGEPLRDILRILHGPLASFIDYPAMASEEMERLKMLSSRAMGIPTQTSVSSTSPDPTQSPTSLDFSLPTTHHTNSTTTEPEINRSQTPENDDRFQYFREKDHFPIGYVHHPLLYDQEVARLYVLWSVLYANQRFELARLLGDFLTIRLKEEYVVSRLLDAGALSLAYSEEDWCWWELLEDPDSSSSDTDSEFDGMELGYPSSDEEITECHNQDQGRAGDCIGTETPAKFPTQYSSAATAATKFSAEFAKATKAAKNVTGSSGGNHMECDGDDPHTSWLPVYSYPPGPPEGYGIRID